MRAGKAASTRVMATNRKNTGAAGIAAKIVNVANAEAKAANMMSTRVTETGTTDTDTVTADPMTEKGAGTGLREPLKRIFSSTVSGAAATI